MKKWVVKKSVLEGTISIPPSKSQTLRAILFAAMANGKSVIHNYLQSPDTQCMIEACRLFGATITIFPDFLEIIGLNGEIKSCEDVINAGNSGIVLRFMASLAAINEKTTVITGDHSIRHIRPMQTLLDGLNELGCLALSTKEDGFAPVIIKGPFTKNKVTLEGKDSQAISGLLIALSFAKGPFEIFVTNPGEKPWILLTLSWLDFLKIPYENNNFEHYKTFGSARFDGFEYRVPADLSSAAFPIAAALITNSEILLKNVDMTDLQGDKELIYLFQKMGANIDIQGTTLHVKKSHALTGVSVDVNNFIDSVPILAVVACFAKGETHIKNATAAKNKECNRLTSITLELKKMGADITETEDGLIINQSNLYGAKVYSHQDHRMCMSLSVAGFGAVGETHIADTACVAKTFPNFITDLCSLKAEMKEIS